MNGMRHQAIYSEDTEYADALGNTGDTGQSLSIHLMQMALNAYVLQNALKVNITHNIEVAG